MKFLLLIKNRSEEGSEKPYRSWHASIMLSSILKDNPQCKELVLKIPLEIPKSGKKKKKNLPFFVWFF